MSAADTPAAPRKCAPKTRGRPFTPGNAGKPKGARNHATRLLQSLFDGAAEAVGRKAVQLAIGGDVSMLALIIARLCPAPRERPVEFPLPAIATVSDLAPAIGAIVTGVANGRLLPGEAEALAALVSRQGEALMAAGLEARLAHIEQLLEADHASVR